MKELRRFAVATRTIRVALLLASGLALVGAAMLGPDGPNGDVAFKLLLGGVALYVFSRIFERR